MSEATNQGPGGGGYYTAFAWRPGAAWELWAVSDVGGPWRFADVRTDDATPQAAGVGNAECDALAWSPDVTTTGLLATAGGLYRTTNAGAAWTLCGGGMTAPNQVWPVYVSNGYANPVCSIAWDPITAGTVLVGGGQSRYLKNGNGRLWLSTDYGATWVRADGSVLNAAAIVHGLCIGDDYALAATDKGLYRATRASGFLTWTAIDLASMGCSTNCRQVATSAADYDVCYLSLLSTVSPAAWDGGCAVSADGGATWALANTGLNVTVNAEDNLYNRYRALAVDPADANHAYLACQGWSNARVYETANGGASWASIFYSSTDRLGWITFNSANPFSLALHPTAGHLVMGSEFMAHLLRDGETTWEEIYGGRAINQVGVTSIVKAGLRLIVAATDVSTVYTDDAGVTWARGTGLNVGQPWSYRLAADPSDPLRLYQGTYGSGTPGFYASTDAGATWTAKGAGLTGKSCLALDIDPRTTGATAVLLCAESSGGLYRSADAGATWAAVTGIGATASVYAVARHPQTRDVLLCAVTGTPASGGGIYQSTDNGATWAAITATPTNFIAPRGVAYTSDGAAILVGAVRAFSGTEFQGGIYRSADGGASYSRVLDNYAVQALHLGATGRLYACSYNPGSIDVSPAMGLWWSHDGGLHWSHYEGINAWGHGGLNAWSVCEDGNTVWFGSGGAGLFSVTLTGEAVAGSARRRIWMF